MNALINEHQQQSQHKYWNIYKRTWATIKIISYDFKSETVIYLDMEP